MRVIRQAGNWAGGPGRRIARWGRWRSIVLGLLGVAAGMWLIRAAAVLYTDWLWFEHLGYRRVLATHLVTQSLLFVGVAGLSGLAFWGNLRLARRFSDKRGQASRESDEALWVFLARVSARLGEESERGTRLHTTILAVGLIAAAIFGLRAAGEWDIVLPALYGVPFGVAEPLFGRDVGFYVFVLPAVRALVGWLFWLAIVVTLGVAATYLVVTAYQLGLTARRAMQALGRAAWTHLAGLGALALALAAASHQLALAELVFSTHGQAAGVGFPGYADAYARAPAYGAMTLAAAGAGGLLVVAGWRRRWQLAAWTGAGYAAVLVLGTLYPLLVQLLVVKPNEPVLERPFITNFIGMTRQGYGLERVRGQFLSERTEARLPDAEALDNVPLWSRPVLRDNLNQLQAFRAYYGFPDVDIDRYEIEGKQRLVMLGLRELNAEALPAGTWVSRHLQFTHGYGVVAALASGVAGEGEPRLLVQDLPPQGVLQVERPEIYFGERTTEYAVVKTTEAEFDFPRGGEAVTTRYEGRGVGIGGALRRAAFALRFGEPSVLLSQSITDESEVLYQRQILERVSALAPFLSFDPDPYPVLAEGRVFWMVDGYTASENYPVSHREALWVADPQRGAVERTANYVRNSVKAVVDAYDGTTSFFVADPSDLVINTYARIYPGLLQPLEAMPDALHAHLRYPRQLFATQAAALARFHVQDPTAFYHGEDLWRFAEEKFETRTEIGPYYAMLRLPGEEREELLLIQPFSPFGAAEERHNLVGLLVGRSDRPRAGELVLHQYPKDRLVAGPFQVERRIDQEASIAAQFGLWQRAGSLVVRSKLLALPLGPTPLYVEAVYLQRGVRPVMPQLRRVILATDSRVVMEPSLDEAVARLKGADGPEQPEDAAALARQLRERLARAQEALTAGDQARFADEMAALEGALRRLEEAVR